MIYLDLSFRCGRRRRGVGSAVFDAAGDVGLVNELAT